MKHKKNLQPIYAAALERVDELKTRPELEEMANAYIYDLAMVDVLTEIANTRELTEDERTILIDIIGTPFHSSGKIEGLQSVDSTCRSPFCCKMKNSVNPLCICLYCYAEDDDKRYKYVGPRHELTARILSTFEFSVNDFKRLKLTTACVRLHEDGDYINDLQSKNEMRICKAFPHIHFAVWFKNVLAVKRALVTEDKPANLIMIYSNPIINLQLNPEKFLNRYTFIDYIFSVYEPGANIEDALQRGENACNGKKCLECGCACYFGLWAPGTIIAEKFRGKRKS